MIRNSYYRIHVLPKQKPNYEKEKEIQIWELGNGTTRKLNCQIYAHKNKTIK